MLGKIFFLFLVMVSFANVLIFVVNINLSQEIALYDRKISLLRQENLDLESKIYQITSYERISSLAAELNFVKNDSPIYLDKLKYAHKR